MKLTVSVLSKSKAYSSPTLHCLLPLFFNKVGVYIFAHSEEVPLYMSMFPQAKVIGHGMRPGDITGMRGFVQEYHYQQKTATLMLDDDIDRISIIDRRDSNQLWDGSILDVLADISSGIESGVDLFLGLTPYQYPLYASSKGHSEYTDGHNPFPHLNFRHYSRMQWSGKAAPISGSAVAFTPALYDRGVRYSGTSLLSEDFYIAFEAYRSPGTVRTLNHLFHSKVENSANFSEEHRVFHAISGYLQYGAIFPLVPFSDDTPPTPFLLDLEALALYGTHGVIYTRTSDAVLTRVRSQQLLGAGMLDDGVSLPGNRYTKLSALFDKNHALFSELRSVYGPPQSFFFAA